MNTKLTKNGKRVKRLMKQTDYSKSTIWRRVRDGWTDKEIIDNPPRKPITISYIGKDLPVADWIKTDLCKTLKLNANTLRIRYIDGWDVGKIFTTPLINKHTRYKDDPIK